MNFLITLDAFAARTFDWLCYSIELRFEESSTGFQILLRIVGNRFANLALRALRVERIDLLASVRGHTDSRSSPTGPSTLAPLSLLGSRVCDCRRRRHRSSSHRRRGWSSRSSDTAGGEQVSSDSEPVKHITLLSGNVMRDPLCANGLEQWTVNLPGPTVHRRVALTRRGGAGVAEHIGPLFDTLSMVAVVESGVTSSVPNLHPGSWSSISWVPGSDKVSPCLRGHRLGSTGALIIPHPSSREAGVRYAGKCRARFEEIGIGAHEDVGHHRTRRRSSRENPVRIDVPGIDRIPHSTGDAQGVATTVMGERCVGMDVPASSTVGGMGIEDHESLVGVCEVGVLGAAKVCLRSTSAVVHGNDKSRVGHQVRGTVAVHPDIGRVGTEAVDLRQLVDST